MSGRGKGGKGLGTETSKKQKTSGDAEADAYQWKDGEGIVVISYAKDADEDIEVYCIPNSRVHPLIKPSVLPNKAHDMSEINIHLADMSHSDDIFDTLTAKDIRKWRDREYEGEDEGDDDDDEADEIDDEDREEVLASISLWLATLHSWRKNPPTTVKIDGRITVLGEI